MDHAKKMPGGTGSMMSRRKTLGSMMNPQPMQFAMGAKMYTHGGSHSGMAVGGRAPAGVSSMGYSKEEMDQLDQMKKMFQNAGGMNTPEGKKIAAKARALQDRISLAEVYERYPDEFGEMPVKSNAMGRMLKEYLKGGKSDAGLKALAASNPNLTYKEAMSGMRLIKDPVGMKSAGEGRKMYQNGTGDPQGDPVPERIDPNDPGFQDFLRATGGRQGAYPYYEEYKGDPIKRGTVLEGKPFGEFDDVILGQYGLGFSGVAVNPELYAFPTSVPEEEGRRLTSDELTTRAFLKRGIPQSIYNQGKRVSGVPRIQMTQGEAIDESIRRYEANLAAEQAYRDYLAKQKKRGPAQPVYRSTPGGGFSVTGTQSQIDATNPNR
tara:strand:- start:1337 stop:2470 length:1134 start_codon:yes stop_codon:yes gene_type:complete